MRLNIVFAGSYTPICAFYYEEQAEQYMKKLLAEPDVRKVQLNRQEHILIKYTGGPIGNAVDDPEMSQGDEVVFMAFIFGGLKGVTRSLDFARDIVHPTSGKGDVLAVDLIHPSSSLPDGPRCEHVSSFGAFWRLTMHERWQKYLKDVNFGE